MKLSEKLRQYIDAGFPILHINSFEEKEIDEKIKTAAKNSGTIDKILEWNYVDKFSEFETKNSISISDSGLIGTLRLLLHQGELEDKILVLKDISSLLEEPEVVALLKKLRKK